MKFGQLIEYNKVNVFFENHAENEAGRLVFVLKKALYEVKASGLQLRFNIIWQPSTCMPSTQLEKIKANSIKL